MPSEDQAIYEEGHAVPYAGFYTIFLCSCNISDPKCNMDPKMADMKGPEIGLIFPKLICFSNAGRCFCEPQTETWSQKLLLCFGRKYPGVSSKNTFCSVPEEA